MGFEPGLFVRPPLRLAWIERSSSYRSVSLSRWFSRTTTRAVEVRDGGGEMGRSRDWPGRASRVCEIAICDNGEVRSGGRVTATPDGIAVLAGSLVASDRVALEVTGSCWEGAPDPRAARQPRRRCESG
jgi:hypothetical protein